MMLTLAIEMNGEREVLRRRELVKALLQLKCIGAEIDVLLTRDQAVHDLDDLRMQKRLAARNGDHRRAALFYGGKALLRRELLLQNVRRILHLAASGTSQVAAKKRLEHEYERVAILPAEALLQHVACDRPHLRNWHCHRFS